MTISVMLQPKHHPVTSVSVLLQTDQQRPT